MRSLLMGTLKVGAIMALILALLPPYVLPLGDSGAFASHNADALALDASLSPTPLQYGHVLTVTVKELNTLAVANDLALTPHWRVQNLSFEPCVYFSRIPFGISLYEGRYTDQNVSLGKQVTIYSPGPYFCGIAFSTDSFHFSARQAVTYSVDLKGYWTEELTPQGSFSQGIVHPFVPDVYTLAAGDVWGHLIFRYFTVLAPSC